MTAPRKPSEILRAAKARIEDPSRWCADKFACDDDGHACGTDSQRAVSWCAVGSLLAEQVLRTAAESDVILFLEDAAYAITGTCSAVLNDRLGHAGAMALYDRAIALAEAEEAKA